MIAFPPRSYALLVRTEFTDDAAWEQVVEEATRPSPEGFVADVRPLSDPAANGAGWEILRDAAMALEHYGQVLCVVDATTLASEDHPILVVSTSRFHRDRYPDEFAAMRPFRCIPSRLWGVENNLNLANMDWEAYATHVDDQGVHRGF